MIKRGPAVSFSLRQIRYFVTAASCGQLSQAAVELNVSQSAVTTAIKLLEEALGATLFVRSSTGVVLTPQGETFLRHARDILASAEAALQSQRPAEPAASGKLRIGVTYSIAGYFIAPILARFLRVYPEFEVTLKEGSRSAIETAVASGQLDLGITLMQAGSPTHDGITSKSLYSWPRRLWLPGNHALLSASTITLKDVARVPYIALTVDEAWTYAMRYWDATTHRPNVIFKTASIEAVRTMIGAGMGVSILSDMLYRHWSLEGQRIEVRDLSTKIPPLDVGYITSKKRAISAGAKRFLGHLQRASGAPGNL